MGPSLMDELELYDQIDDLLDFPLDDEYCDATLVDCKDFPSWDDALPDSQPLFSAELSVPYEDIVQLEWLSTFVEESFSSEGLTLGKEKLRGSNTTTNHRFQTMSPVSVLESSSSSSSSSSSGGKTMPLSPGHRGPQRARSKRPRPAMFNPRPAIHLVSPSSPAYPLITPGFSSESDSFAESPPLKTKPKKIKITLSDAKHHDPPVQAAVRKCLHCEITKTPQWRAGPMGPKTLCNACGVRYKSGRLFPEYRPAASPTFVASVHSNSHKKVLEMRTKIEPNTTAALP